MRVGRVRERRPEVGRARFDDAGVDAAVRARGRGQREERHFGVGDRRVVGRGPQAAARVRADEVVEPRLGDGRLAGVQGRHDRLVDVHARDRVAEFGEARRDGRPDVAAADDGELHRGDRPGPRLSGFGLPSAANSVAPSAGPTRHASANATGAG